MNTAKEKLYKQLGQYNEKWVKQRTLKCIIEPGLIKFVSTYYRPDEIREYNNIKEKYNWVNFLDEYGLTPDDVKLNNIIVGGYEPSETRKAQLERMEKARKAANEYRKEGKFSDSAKKNLHNKINCLWLNSGSWVAKFWDKGKLKTVRYRLVFLTLTIPDNWQVEKYSFCVNVLLHAFERVLREEYGANYVWKGELQRRGTPHFHIIMDKFIDKWTVTEIWNRILQVYGAMENYTLRTGKSEAFATNVRAVNSLRRLRNYLSKYFMKPVTDQKICLNARLWGCSKLLKGAKCPEFDAEKELDHEFFMQLQNEFANKTKKYQIMGDTEEIVFATVFVFKQERFFYEFLELFDLNFEGYLFD